MTCERRKSERRSGVLVRTWRRRFSERFHFLDHAGQGHQPATDTAAQQFIHFGDQPARAVKIQEVNLAGLGVVQLGRASEGIGSGDLSQTFPDARASQGTSSSGVREGGRASSASPSRVSLRKWLNRLPGEVWVRRIIGAEDWKRNRALANTI